MRTMSAKVENDVHERFLEYCNQKGMTVNEALGEILKFIASALRGKSSLEQWPYIFQGLGEMKLDTAQDISTNTFDCINRCPIIKWWWERYDKSDEFKKLWPEV